jgi:hypothetical protein
VNSPEETPRSTNEPGDVVLESASREELVQEVYGLQASLSAARAQKELAETRLELAQQDLKRQLLRVKQYREFGRQWRELLVSEVGRLGAELERVNQEAEACLKVLMQLAEEPDGQHVPSLVETVLGRRDWLARATQREKELLQMAPVEVPEELLGNLKRMGMKFQGEKVPDWMEQSERKPAGMTDEEQLEADWPPVPAPPSQYPGDGTGDSGVQPGGQA